MKFDTPATTNPIDRLQAVGHPIDRVEGDLKTTGRATYAYEQHEATPNAVYGYIVGAGVARGTITALRVRTAREAPGVLAIVTHENAGKLGVGEAYVDRMLAGPQVDHYHQAVALVVAETFEQARHAAGMVHVDYLHAAGSFDLAKAKDGAVTAAEGGWEPAQSSTGDFARAFAQAEVQHDATYTTPDQAHAMMEPHATVAKWDGDQLTCWSPIQQLNWGVRDLAKILGITPKNVRIVAPYIGGSFGGKGSALADCVLAALGARAAKRPVKVALTRSLMFNNTSHRPATIQRIRIGTNRAGIINAIGHESWSGNLRGGVPEGTTTSTHLLYAGPNRMTHLRQVVLDLAEGGAMRAPGESSGMMALEIAMDELAEKLKIDPVQLRILNDTQVDPENPSRRFSVRQLVQCLRTGAERFGWKPHPGGPRLARDGDWLIGVGMASAIRGAPVQKSAARVRLNRMGIVTVETDMTDVGTGSYTILAQTAAEMMGVDVRMVVMRLGDSRLPESPGTGGQWGAASATAGVYAACVKLREIVARQLDMAPEAALFENGQVRAGPRSVPLADAAQHAELVAEDTMEYGDLAKQYAQQTFGAHFVEVAVHAATGEIRLRRMLAVCAAGRIINPKTARSQVIGAMTMGAGAALMEEMVVDKRHGFFVNHDLAGYEVPVHADIPHQDVIFLDELDPFIAPLKAKGVGELGIVGVAAAISNAVYDATGVRVRDYPIRLDRFLDRLPPMS